MTGTGPIPGLNPRVPTAARVYDYMLGGKDNFAADRELAEQLIANAPESPWIARQNRAFLGRAVRYCAEHGIRQFLDLGSGLPTQENVHEVAQRVDPSSRVVYVDNDPMAVLHARALLANGAGVVAVDGDLRRPAEIIANDEVRRLIDFSRPTAVLIVSIFHFTPDSEDPAGIVAQYVDAMAPGSYLVLSHATHDVKPDKASKARDLYRRAASPMITRSKAAVGALFGDLELVDPGLVFTAEWRPYDEVPEPETSGLYAGVARKPGR